MKFELNINMDTAAFRDDPDGEGEYQPNLELENRLNRIALAVGKGNRKGKVIDSNGNHVGDWAIT